MEFFDQLKFATPWIVLSVGILVTMLVSVIRVNTKRPAQIFALLTLAATFFCAVTAIPENTQTIFNGAMEVSSLSFLSLALLSGLGIFFILGTSRYLTKEEIHLSDYYHLLLILILGASVLTSAKDLVVMFIALEVMSLPAYTLTGFRRNDARSNEAAIKYYILGGAIGAIFLLGASFVFGATGTTQLAKIFVWSQQFHGDLSLFYVGHALLLIAFLFKVAAVPFHFWKPDVYEGAPTSVTGIMATMISAAAFVVLARLLHLVDLSQTQWLNYADHLKQLVRVLATLSLVVGSTILITQTSLKRMLAYSSISHTGFVLLGLLGSLTVPTEIYSVWMYVLAYSIMTSGFFVMLSMSEPKADRGTELIDLTGMLKRSPFNTLLLSIFFFSMAGMPFTVGFFAKYMVLLASMNAGETLYVVIAALCAVIGAYAYLRPVALMVMRDADPSAAEFKGSVVGRVMVAISAALVIGMGVMPNSIIHFLKGIPLSR
jgi:NADH-quinone oxidoreductase subunit N